MIRIKRKGQMGYALVMLSVFVIVALIMLIFQDEFLALMRGVGEDQTCVWSTVFQSASKTYGSVVYNLDCPVELVTIGLKEDKKENVVGVDKKLTRWLTKKIEKWDEEIDLDFHKTYVEGKHKEYRLNEIMANEMKSCWNKMGRGELDLFSDWFTERIIYDTKLGAWFFKEDIERKKSLGDEDNEVYGGAPRVCVICSRIVFKDEIDSLKINEDPDPLFDWARFHPVNERSPKPISYVEFLKDDVTKSDFFGKSGYEYTTTEPYATLFVRVNVYYPLIIARNIVELAEYFGLIDEKNQYAPADAVLLVPYDKINQECDEIMN